MSHTVINNAGTVVGHSTNVQGYMEAVLWNGTTATKLPGLGGDGARATAINDKGQIVGQSNGRTVDPLQ